MSKSKERAVPLTTIDESVILFAIYDAIAARKMPPTRDQLELRLFGLSSDWLARRLSDAFERWGTFPIVERYLMRWHRPERVRDRARLYDALAAGERRGLWRAEPGARGDRFRLSMSADAAAEILIGTAARA